MVINRRFFKNNFIALPACSTFIQVPKTGVTLYCEKQIIEQGLII